MKWIIGLVFTMTACVVGDEAEDGDTDLADEATDASDALQAPRSYSVKGDPSPSGDFNLNGKHNDQCVRLAGVTPLRYADGTPTGYRLDPAQLKFNPERRPVDDSSGKPCLDGTVQLDTQEIISAKVDGQTQRMLFHRGGFPYSPAGNAKYGHVLIGDTLDHADVGRTQANGAECGASQNASTKGDYRVQARSIPEGMTFRKSNYSACAAAAGNDVEKLEACTNGYQSYGDPGFDQGSFAAADRRHYTYLLWNFTNVSGGGVVRADLAPGTVFHRCNVRAIKQLAYSSTGRREIGWVKAVYGKARVGDGWSYGWIVHSHQCKAGEPECAGQPAGVVLHVNGL